MKKSVPSSRAMISLAVLTPLAIATAARAETAAAPPSSLAPVQFPTLALPASPVATPPALASWRFFPVRNVPPALMAWWIDPAHNPRPAVPPDIHLALLPRDPIASGQVVRLPVQIQLPRGPADPRLQLIRLPEGVESVIPLPGKTGVLANGGAAGLLRLQGLLQMLDKPVPFVDVEITALELATNVKPVVQGEYHGAIAAIIAAGGIVLSDSHLTTANNTTAVSTTTRSFVGAAINGDYPGYMTVQDEIGVTPSINSDGTVTIDVGIQHSTTPCDEVTGPGEKKQMRFHTTANVKDGDTIAIGGTYLRKDAGNPTTAPLYDLFIFAAAHVIKPNP